MERVLLDGLEDHKSSGIYESVSERGIKVWNVVIENSVNQNTNYYSILQSLLNNYLPSNKRSLIYGVLVGYSGFYIIASETLSIVDVATWLIGFKSYVDTYKSKDEEISGYIIMICTDLDNFYNETLYKYEENLCKDLVTPVKENFKYNEDDEEPSVGDCCNSRGES